MQPQNRRIPIVRAEAVATSVLRRALHHGDAARGDGAPGGRGLAARPLARHDVPPDELGGARRLNGERTSGLATILIRGRASGSHH